MIQVTGGPGVELTIGMAGSESHQDSICSLLSADIILRQAFPLMAMRWLLEAPGYKLSSGMRGLPKSCNQSPPVETHFLWLAALGHVPILLGGGECSALIWSDPCHVFTPGALRGPHHPKADGAGKSFLRRKGWETGLAPTYSSRFHYRIQSSLTPKARKASPTRFRVNQILPAASLFRLKNNNKCKAYRQSVCLQLTSKSRLCFQNFCVLI